MYLLAEGIVNNVVADYLWARAVVLTSATVATVGLSITIPIAIMTDTFLGNQNLTLPKISGAVLVLIGFLVVNLSGLVSSEEPSINDQNVDAKNSSFGSENANLPSVIVEECPSDS